jgi:hypothetical protein
MNNFKQFNIQPSSKSFEGDKIKMYNILNRPITVHDFKIEDSKHKQNEKCLYLSISIDNVKRIVFTGSKNLMDMIQQVPATGFPFETTIIKENERYQFT